MIQEIDEMISLKDYANKYSIEQISSEDIIKLMLKPYLISEIVTAFGITEKEFNHIRKKKGLTNVNLETIIRDIETIIYYLDSKNKYFSNKVIKKIVDNLIPIFIIELPQKQFYVKELSKINFNREMIMNDILIKK